MFKFSQKYAVDRSILNCECLRYNLLSLFLVNGEDSQTFIFLSREHGAISLQGNYLELGFSVAYRAGGHARYADGN